MVIFDVLILMCALFDVVGASHRVHGKWNTLDEFVPEMGDDRRIPNQQQAISTNLLLGRSDARYLEISQECENDTKELLGSQQVEDYWDSVLWVCKADIDCILIIDDWDEVCTSVDGLPLSVDTFTLRCTDTSQKGYKYNLNMQVENYSDCVAQSCGDDDIEEIVNGTQNNYEFIKRFLMSEDIDCYNVDERNQLSTGGVFGLIIFVLLVFFLVLVCMKYMC
eukprot:CAMPEP_0198287778 /NCGR_PEP_ID=MMETSP1449-20131203/6484_1 /TAXON_ID=420275 /ORGANISM="Attheya septentrionalis, Strain CCMP2084" /LENGTH=221 /DNA_ID=CAMNT_0043985795 /DNA_START=91 /DNA_END=756 /DNA_ORIENTATION=+